MKRLGLALLATIALAGCGGPDAPVTKEVQARGLTYAQGVTADDREWIEQALKGARPEAAALIDDVDGMVTITTAGPPDAPGPGSRMKSRPAASRSPSTSPTSTASASRTAT